MRKFWVFLWKSERVSWWEETEDDEMVELMFLTLFL